MVFWLQINKLVLQSSFLLFNTILLRKLKWPPQRRHIFGFSGPIERHLADFDIRSQLMFVSVHGSLLIYLNSFVWVMTDLKISYEILLNMKYAIGLIDNESRKLIYTDMMAHYYS
jgi:hypothetical protein